MVFEMKLRMLLKIAIILFLFSLTKQSFAMGLRSFVALPLEKEGTVLRLQNIDTLNNDKNVMVANLAYGISGKQTLLLSIPYRLSPKGTNRLGDLNVLYRHTAWQKDFFEGTYRLGCWVVA